VLSRSFECLPASFLEPSAMDARKLQVRSSAASSASTSSTSAHLLPAACLLILGLLQRRGNSASIENRCTTINPILLYKMQNGEWIMTSVGDSLRNRSHVQTIHCAPKHRSQPSCLIIHPHMGWKRTYVVYIAYIYGWCSSY
jgi:hypothetical protein